MTNEDKDRIRDNWPDNDNQDQLHDRLEKLESIEEGRSAHRKFQYRILALMLGFAAIAWIWSKFD